MSMFTRNPFKQETGSSKEMKALAHEAANDSVEKIVDSMRTEHNDTRKQVEKARVEVATNSEILAALKEEISSARDDFSTTSDNIAGYKETLADISAKLVTLADSQAAQDNFLQESKDKITDVVIRLEEQLDNIEKQEEAIMKARTTKMDNILTNFPKLEENVVRRVNAINSEQTQAMTEEIDKIKAHQRKDGTFTRIMLSISLIFNIILTSGIVVIILYLADMIKL